MRNSHYCKNPYCFEGTCKGECRRKFRLIIALICFFAIWVGAGCQNLKEVDLSITGFEAEWYEPADPAPITVVAPTNSPAGSWFPQLMPRKNAKK